MCYPLSMHRSHNLDRPLIALFALVAATLGACEQQSARNDTENAAQPAPPQIPALPVREPVFDREALLLAVTRAASAYATGADDLEAQRQLDGRQFEVRVRLGCAGPGAIEGKSGWSFDSETRRLRVRAAPDLSLDDQLVRRLLGEGVEEVEGFWLPRPWLLSADCPRTAALVPAKSETGAAAGAGKAEPAEEEEAATAAAPATRAARVGIAQIYTEEDDRTRRRSGRPYESAKDLPQGVQPSGLGFNLVLSGRIRARPGGRIVHCSSSGADSPPDCIVSADIDRVWIERPDDRTIIAEWHS